MRCGFIIVVEDSQQPSTQQIFQNLSKPYSATGWPSFGVFVRNGVESISTYKWMAGNSGVIDYVHAEEFESSKISDLFYSWWLKVSSKTEDLICHPSLKESLIAVASKSNADPQLLFFDQASSILLPKLNISWKEAIAIRLAPLVFEVMESSPEILSPHPAIVKITREITGCFHENFDIRGVGNKDIAIAVRTACLIRYLSLANASGNLESSLASLLDNLSPRSPAIIRQLSSVSDRLLNISERAKAA